MAKLARSTVATRLIALGALLATVTVSTVASAGLVGTPGAAGVGDSYFPLAGNGGYDVGHYDLEVRYAPASNKLFGDVTITATATHDLSSFHLDFEGMTIRALTVDAVAASWTREMGQELIVTPVTPIADGASFAIHVEYDGVPKKVNSYGAASGAIPTDDGVLIYGEPDVAAYWFPSNDHPSDKATFSIALTVPEELKAISNGRLLSREPDGPGRVRWTWEESTPMATYLAMAAIGKFRINQRDIAGGIRVLDAIDSRLDRRVQRSLQSEVTALRFLEEQFGTYPFDDVGGIVEMGHIQFALENQTRPIYPGNGNGPSLFLVIHELSHQWFGDSVALADWQHMWLNEGFATYAEILWAEEKGTYSPEAFLTDWCAVPGSDNFWDIAPGDPGVDDLFSRPVYVRGGLTLQALRETVGDADFFEILHMWLADHANANASTDDFIALSESVSGQELSALFDDWLFSANKPSPCVVGAAALATNSLAGATPQVPRSLVPRAGHSLA